MCKKMIIALIASTLLVGCNSTTTTSQATENVAETTIQSTTETVTVTEASTSDNKYTFTIVGGEKTKVFDGTEVLNVTIKMENNSGQSISPLETGYGVWGFQNGQDMKLMYDNDVQKATNMTKVQSGYTLEYNVLLALIDNSPVTVELKEKATNKLIATKEITLE
jgi:uncharacterized protein YceK